MENQFTALTKSYYDNYLQYKLTGNSSYQNAYQSAQQGIEAILANLSSEVNAEQQNIKDFYSDDVEEKMKETQSDIRKRQHEIVNENDKIEAAKMRASVTSSGSTISAPSYTTEYTVLAALGITALALMVIRQN